GGEFGNGGKRINSHLEGKLVTVGKATPRIVREPFGKLDGQGFFLREGAIELYVVNRAHGDFCFAPLVVFTGQFRPVDFFAGFQDDFFRQLRRYRRGEVEPHGEERNTGGVGIGTVAVEGDGELVAHRVGEDLLLSGGDPGGGGDAGSPDQLHLRLGRETLAAADGECPVVIGTSRRFEHCRALRSGDQAYAERLGDPSHTEPDLGQHRRFIGLAVQVKDEDLLLVNGLAVAGAGAEHGRAAGGEGKDPLAADHAT